MRTTVNLVDEDAGAIRGYVGALRSREGLGHIFTLNVHPHERRRGLGRALMDACEERLRARGILDVRLEVHVDNAAAIALYESMGYDRMRRLKNYYRHEGGGDASADASSSSAAASGGDAWVYLKRLA